MTIETGLIEIFLSTMQYIYSVCSHVNAHNNYYARDLLFRGQLRANYLIIRKQINRVVGGTATDRINRFIQLV